jgi:hypothetical protein
MSEGDSLPQITLFLLITDEDRLLLTLTSTSQI